MCLGFAKAKQIVAVDRLYGTVYLEPLLRSLRSGSSRPSTISSPPPSSDMNYNRGPQQYQHYPHDPYHLLLFLAKAES